jgi:hypothetical protein
MDFDVAIEVHEGRKKKTIYADVLVYTSTRKTAPLLVCETKSPVETLNRSVKEQAISYTHPLHFQTGRVASAPPLSPATIAKVLAPAVDIVEKDKESAGKGVIRPAALARLRPSITERGEQRPASHKDEDD